MARALVLKINNTEVTCNPEKVDRTRLYGFVDVEALDGKGRKCVLATVAEDGRTIVGAGGSAFAQLSPDGEWLDKSKLKAVDREGKPVTPVESSYSAPVAVTKTATIEEYLSHNIKGVYLLNPQDASALVTELKKGTIYTFPYSFRGGLEADVGFLLATPEGTPFFCVGQPTSLHFVGLEQVTAPVDDDAEAGLDDESVDFGMM